MHEVGHRAARGRWSNRLDWLQMPYRRNLFDSVASPASMPSAELSAASSAARFPARGPRRLRRWNRLRDVPQPPAASQEDIFNYISNAWNALQRSMSECASLVDPKLATQTRVLYLPAFADIPPEVQKLEQECQVHIERCQNGSRTLAG